MDKYARIYQRRPKSPGSFVHSDEEYCYGSYDTVEQAKGDAEAIGARWYPSGTFHWDQASPTTWELMSDGQCTNIWVIWAG